MQRIFIQLPSFSRYYDNFVNKGRILETDFEALEQELLKNPQTGVVIPGLLGLRKTRLKSAHSGKRGGFRVDYLDTPCCIIAWKYKTLIFNYLPQRSQSTQREEKISALF